MTGERALGGRRPGRLVVGLLGMFVATGIGCGSTPDPDNELPFGFVDRPLPEDIVGREVEVAGWALDDSGIDTIRLYVDGRYQTSARPSVHRPDVVQAHPTHATQKSFQGWQALVDLGEQAGPHVILVQAVDDNGATRDIGTVGVTLLAR